MKRLLLNLLICGLFTSKIYSQNTFYREFHSGGMALSLYVSAANCLNDTEYFAIQNIHWGACSNDYSIKIVNGHGQNIGFLNQASSYSSFLEKSPENMLYCVGIDDDCGDSSNINISKVGLQSTSNWMRKIRGLDYANGISALLGSDSSITIRYYYSNDTNQHFIKYSSLGSILLSKTLRYGDGATIMASGTSDNIYLARNIQDSLNGYSVEVLRLNSNVDSISKFNLNSDSINKILGMRIRKNGNILIYGAKSIPTVPITYKKFMAEIDNNGVLIWKNSKWFNGLPNFITYCETLDSGLALIFANGPTDNFILRCNNKADSIWQKNYHMLPDFSFRSIKTTMDSGFVLGGQKNSGDIGFILKTNAYGDTGNMTTAINYIPYQSKSSFRILPNPINDIGIIHVEGILKNSELRIENGMGEFLYAIKLEQTFGDISFDANDLKAGFYICGLWSNNKKILSQKIFVVR